MDKVISTSKFIGFLAGAYLGVSGVLLKSLLKNDIITSPNTPKDINLDYKEISFLRLSEAVDIFEALTKNEMDLRLEAAAADELSNNFDNDERFIVPDVLKRNGE